MASGQQQVLIIDDHPLFSDALKSLLLAINPQAIVFQAKSVLDAERFANHAIELVLMDLQMSGLSGMAALAHVKTLFQASSIVVVSGDESAQTIHQAIQHGAAGYVPKSTNAAITIHALNLVMSKGIYLPPEVLNRSEPAPSTATKPRAWSNAISPRQLVVLQCLLQGKSNKVIARDIGIAEGTVKAHLWAIYQLLGVSSRSQAMYRVHELKLFGVLN